MLKKFAPLAIFVLMLVFLGIGLTRDPSHIPSPLIDKPMPVFDLARLKDEQQRLASGDLLGEVALINVWASWCVGCRIEHDVLLSLSRRKVVNIYGLNYKDRREDALAWLQRFGDPYTSTAHDLEGKVGIDFGVYGAPETFLIDQQGVIRYKHIGPLTSEIIEKELLPRIEQLKVAGS